jgi:hypothetical protein
MISRTFDKSVILIFNQILQTDGRKLCILQLDIRKKNVAPRIEWKKLPTYTLYIGT